MHIAHIEQKESEKENEPMQLEVLAHGKGEHFHLAQCKNILVHRPMCGIACLSGGNLLFVHMLT